MHTIPKGLMSPEKKLKEYLLSIDIHDVLPLSLSSNNCYIMDLSMNNSDLDKIDLNSEEEFCNYINGVIDEHGCQIGIGGYNENRNLYSRSEVFNGVENRTLHLGVDLWGNEGTPVTAPLYGKVHSYRNNNNHGDYGPTIILEHQIHDISFYTLYGHLSSESLNGLHKGKIIEAGEEFAWFGAYHENVHWPPHLHFQLILDMEGMEGDYPGVCKPSESKKWLKNCPDPNLILKFEGI